MPTKDWSTVAFRNIIVRVHAESAACTRTIIAERALGIESGRRTRAANLRANT